MSSIPEALSRSLNKPEQKLLKDLFDPQAYVGEVFSLSYETALLQVHDYHRRKVGGIPALSFLIATRINPDEDFDVESEDASVILLRVMDKADLPSEAEATNIRVELSRRVSGDPNLNWEAEEVMDPETNNLLSFAGVKCRVIGTFYVTRENNPGQTPQSALSFGSDISNYYPNRGLKVYKPKGKSLSRIVNYRSEPTNHEVEIGFVRYASTHRRFQNVDDVPVNITPEDLSGQKTALFGMTRTGKSNTVKTIASAVFAMRWKPGNERKIGQIIFDPDGEYANVNTQDAGHPEYPSALKNVWMEGPTDRHAELRSDIVTYGITRPDYDPERKLMLVNFYEDRNLQVGKEIIDEFLAQSGSRSSNYIANFRDVRFIESPGSTGGETTRHKRRVFVYRALLYRAGFSVPSDFRPDAKNLFNRQLRNAMRYEGEQYSNAATLIEKNSLSWADAARFCEVLEEFIRSNPGKAYTEFNDEYIKNSSSGEWADEDLKKILAMWQYTNGPRLIGAALPHHTDDTGDDFAADIYEHLKAGRMVIVDQSSGDLPLNKASAYRTMEYIFKRNQELFRSGKKPHNILVYVEEAHDILPASNELNLSDTWIRTAKEGAKYHIGLVYSTQEVSSIQPNILKNTTNWFIGHLNNTDETRELRKYYDFADFEASIKRAADKGFLRIKTLSNQYVVPAQIKQFRISALLPPAASKEQMLMKIGD